MKTPLFAILMTIMTISPAFSENLTIGGTEAGIDILGKTAREFMQTNDSVVIVLPPSIGSSEIIAAVGKNKTGIGRISRPLTAGEAGYNLTYLELERIPLVFYTHPSAMVSSLSMLQIAQIYEGRIDNWKTVGGADLPIRLVNRPKEDSSSDVLLASSNNSPAKNFYEAATFSDGQTIEYVMAFKGSIAFGNVEKLAGKAVTVLSVEGLTPYDPRYPFNTTLALVYKAKNLSREARLFIDFCQEKYPTAF